MAKVLIIEDSEAQRALFASMLQAGGHHVRSVHDAPAAMLLLAKEEFDLVVTDIFMPGCDGMEFIRGVRRVYPDLPVVAMTAGFCGESAIFLRMAKLLGATQVVNKLAGPRELVEAVDALLSDCRDDDVAAHD